MNEALLRGRESDEVPGSAVNSISDGVRCYRPASKKPVSSSIVPKNKHSVAPSKLRSASKAEFASAKREAQRVPQEAEELE